MGLIRRLSTLTAVATFLLIVVGGAVRVSGSGLGCPDWPTCNGQIIPPLVLQPAIEYAHRFVAVLVSILVVLAAGLAWSRFRQYGWIVVPTILAIFLLALQIALGALTVWLELTPGLVSAHLDTALALFATVMITAAAAYWVTESDRGFRLDGFGALAIATTLLAYVLQVVGAFISESNAAYACPAWPLCGTGLQLPSDGASALNLLHRVMSAVLVALVVALVVRVRRARPGEKALGSLLYAGVALLAAQIVIGAAVVIWRIPPATALLHLTVASLFWADLIAVTMLTCFPRVSVLATDPSKELRDLIRAYLNLTKPRIVVLLLITTFGGMVIAARGLPSFGLILATMLGGACAAGGANAINCYIDRDIDQLMHRTQKRSLPQGRVPPRGALLFGLALGALSFLVLTLWANLLSAILALAGLLFYVFIYTRILKRTTPQNIVIGGAAGAMPPMVGWAAVTGRLDLVALYMFAVIFFWTPPHFWALSLLTAQDYARANVPMLPLVAGEDETRRQIFLYSVLLVAVTMLLVSGRAMGFLYLVAALGLGGGLIYYAAKLLRDGSRARARQLFMYSNIYLALLFLAMALDRTIASSLF